MPDAISAVSAATPAASLPSTSLSSIAPAGDDGFDNALGASVDHLQAMQANADNLAIRAVTGDLDDVHDYTIAATEAKVTLELAAAVRNKAIEAFSEIMRMQA